VDVTMVIRLIAGLLFVVVFFAMIPPYWMIFKKAGFSPWLSLLMYVPLVNIIVLYVVGFSDWKTYLLPRPHRPGLLHLDPNALLPEQVPARELGILRSSVGHSTRARL